MAGYGALGFIKGAADAATQQAQRASDVVFRNADEERTRTMRQPHLDAITELGTYLMGDTPPTPEALEGIRARLQGADPAIVGQMNTLLDRIGTRAIEAPGRARQAAADAQSAEARGLQITATGEQLTEVQDTRNRRNTSRTELDAFVQANPNWTRDPNLAGRVLGLAKAAGDVALETQAEQVIAANIRKEQAGLQRELTQTRTAGRGSGIERATPRQAALVKAAGMQLENALLNAGDDAVAIDAAQERHDAEIERIFGGTQAGASDPIAEFTTAYNAANAANKGAAFLQRVIADSSTLPAVRAEAQRLLGTPPRTGGGPRADTVPPPPVFYRDREGPQVIQAREREARTRQRTADAQRRSEQQAADEIRRQQNIYRTGR